MVFFCKQKTAYEIVSRDWSSDVCSSDLNLYTANRQNRIGGGVAIYICSCIIVKVLERHMSPTVSAIWLLLPYPKMPKMIVGCFYHPPSTDKSTSLRYLEETLCKLMSKHKNAKILLAEISTEYRWIFSVNNSI